MKLNKSCETIRFILQSRPLSIACLDAVGRGSIPRQDLGSIFDTLGSSGLISQYANVDRRVKGYERQRYVCMPTEKAAEREIITGGLFILS